MTNENTTLCVFILGRSELAQAALDNLPRMHQTLIFGPDVAKSKDARRVREP